MVSPGIAVRGGRPEDIPHLVDLTARFVEGCAEDIAGGGIPQKRKLLVKGLIGDPPAGMIGDPAEEVRMRPVIADPVCHDSDLDIGVLIDERLDDLFEEFDPLLEGIETGRPEIEKGVRIRR